MRIFITFALLFMFSMAGIFFVHNKTDILNAWEARGKYSYRHMTQTCLEVKDKVYAPCFLKKVEEFFKSVSLTGVSVGVSFGLEFMEEDKKNSERYPEGIQRDIQYALYYLELNNLALDYANKQFLGIKAFYGFFLSALYNYYSKAFEFSEDMIKGLESDEGLLKIEDEALRQKFTQRFKALKERYLDLREEKENWLEKEKNRLENEK